MNQIEKTAALNISENFELKSTDFSFQELHKLLVNRIDFLVRSDPEKLFSILYRIDVPESKARKALETTGNPSEALADLIIQRQLEKVKTRMEFGRDPHGDW